MKKINATVILYLKKINESVNLYLVRNDKSKKKESKKNVYFERQNTT